MLIESDNDGLLDRDEANNVRQPIDTDADGVADYLDLDSDGDGALDIIEAGGPDVDQDGQVDSWSDSDAEGVPDSVDADITGGEDADSGGIDDSADSDFVAEPDSDGDGIVDRFDDDFAGTGFIPYIPGEPTLGTALPDANGNGVPDVLEVNSAAASAQDIIRTGLAGGGCSLGSNQAATDPTLLILVLASGAITGLSQRRRRRATGR